MLPKKNETTMKKEQPYRAYTSIGTVQWNNRTVAYEDFVFIAAAQ